MSFIGVARHIPNLITSLAEGQNQTGPIDEKWRFSKKFSTNQGVFNTFSQQKSVAFRGLLLLLVRIFPASYSAKSYCCWTFKAK
jgi:hypothetical protein